MTGLIAGAQVSAYLKVPTSEAILLWWLPGWCHGALVLVTTDRGHGGGRNGVESKHDGAHLSEPSRLRKRTGHRAPAPVPSRWCPPICASLLNHWSTAGRTPLRWRGSRRSTLRNDPRPYVWAADQILDTSIETPHRRAWRPGGTRQAWRRKPGGRTRVALVTRTKLIVS